MTKDEELENLRKRAAETDLKLTFHSSGLIMISREYRMGLEKKILEVVATMREMAETKRQMLLDAIDSQYLQ